MTLGLLSSWTVFKMLLLLLCLLPVVGQNIPPTPPMIEIQQGKLSGLWWATRGGRDIAAFLGIPFATPPISSLRFKNPKPPKPWSGVYPAVKDAPACVQSTEYKLPDNPATTSEDCLYLNVFTPYLKTPVKLPVLVFVVGGAFERGSSSSSAYGPEFLLDEDIVLITLNYRLGILGFLSLEHPILPGNLGLKDQREALRWVQANIAVFGGDPHLVTIWGQSAGAASVHFHLQTSYQEGRKYCQQDRSECQNGLFRALIADSGTSRSTYAFNRPGSQKPSVDKLVHFTGCPGEPQQLVNCLQEIPADTFVSLLERIRETELDIQKHRPVFSPMMEPECAEDVIVVADPWNTVTNIPILQGTNQYEALLSLQDYEMDQTDRLFDELNKYYRTVLPYNQNIDETAQNSSAVGESLKQFYFGNSNIDRDHFINLVDCATDARYNYPLVESARANKGKTFIYHMRYKGANTMTRYLGNTKYYGATHFDELFYLFPIGGTSKRNLTLRDTELSKQMVKLWTNFVKYLEPAPQGHPTTWTPVLTPSIEYLDIGQFGFSMQGNFLKPQMDFWSKLPFRNKPETGRPICSLS